MPYQTVYCPSIESSASLSTAASPPPKIYRGGKQCGRSCPHSPVRRDNRTAGPQRQERPRWRNPTASDSSRRCSSVNWGRRGREPMPDPSPTQTATAGLPSNHLRRPRSPRFEDVWQGAGAPSMRLNDRLHSSCPLQTYPGLANCSSQMAAACIAPPYSAPLLNPRPPRNHLMHRGATPHERRTKFARDFVQTDPKSGRVEMMTKRRPGAANLDVQTPHFDAYESHMGKRLVGTDTPFIQGSNISYMLPHTGAEQKYRSGTAGTHNRPADNLRVVGGYLTTVPADDAKRHVSHPADLGYQTRKINARWAKSSSDSSGAP